MIKKSISILLSIIMLFSVVGITPISVSAQEAEKAGDGANADIAETGGYYDYGTFNARLNTCKSDYPHGSYSGWQAPSGWYECWAYANQITYRIFGSFGYTWDYHQDRSEIYPGDLIRYGGAYGTGHSIVVTAVDGDTIYYTDRNGTANYNMVRWGASINRWDIYFISGDKGRQGIYHAPNWNSVIPWVNPVPKPSNAWISASRRALPIGWDIAFTFGANNVEHFDIGIDRNGSRIITETVTSGKSYHFTEEGDYSAYVTAYNSSGYVDSNRVYFNVYRANNMGEKFTAAILNTSTGVAVTVGDDNRNVVVKQYKGTDDQLWLFERNANGNTRDYKITNIKTGYCLDDVDFGTSDNTNIIARPSNDSDAERWYIRSNGTGYSIVPKCAPHGCIDMVGGDSSDGNNIAMWACVQGNSNQIFTLQVKDKPAYSKSFNGHKYELYNTSVSWKEAFQFCEQQGGHLVTINSREEQDFVNSLLSHSTHKRIWAGGFDLNTEGEWQWITGEAFTYKNWGTGEPNNSGDEDHLMLSKSDGVWNDVYDVFLYTDNEYSFICEYEDTIDPSRTKLESSFNYNNHRYEIYSGSLDWQSAKLFCEQKGGHLATVTSSGENDKIVSALKNLKHEAYWIGLTDIDIESKWHWITGEDYSYTNWISGEPNNTRGIEDCAVYNPSSGKWNDLTSRAVCSYDTGFICEYDTIEITDDMVTAKDVITTSDANTITPQVTVKWNNTTLRVNTDYTVSIAGDVADGSGTITVTGKGIYSGTVTKSFKITINDTTVVNDFFGNKFETEKGEIITYYANLTSPIQVNHLNGVIYYNQEVLEPIIAEDIGYNLPVFENGHFMPMGAGQMRFDVYSNKPLSLDNVMVIRMQFRVIKKGGETWLGHQFETPEFTYENLNNYDLDTYILTDQELYDPTKEILGDADGDGDIAAIDVTQIMRSCAHINIGINKDILMNADVDGNGILEITDATYIQRYLARQQTPYEIGKAV